MDEIRRFFFIFFILILVLNILDFTFTMYLLNYNDNFVEGNPIVRHALENNQHFYIFLIKFIAPFLFYFIAIKGFQDKRLVKKRFYVRFVFSLSTFIILFYGIVVTDLGWFILLR